jgi:hypothetical protein
MELTMAAEFSATDCHYDAEPSATDLYKVISFVKFFFKVRSAVEIHTFQLYQKGFLTAQSVGADVGAMWVRDVT